MKAEKKQVLTVKNIRNVNTENILQSVIKNRSTTRSVLAKENHISLMTVKHVVDSLMAAGYLVEEESCNAEVGRNPKVLRLARKFGHILCVNLTSKDELSYLIYDIYENLLEEGSVPLEEKRAYRDTLTELLEKAEERIKVLDTETVGAAVFVPSAYDETVDLVNYDLIADFKELHIRTLFKEKFKIENILILHDVFAAARAEYDGLEHKARSQFYFYCGYGVGGCFISGDEAVSGHQRMAGEVGKMLVSMDGSGEDCRILEDMVSVSAVKKQMKACGLHMKFAELLEQYEAGEKQAVDFLEPVLNTISRLLYNLLWVYNPERVVIDSCKSVYCQAIAQHFQGFMERMKNDAIPVSVRVDQAIYDEYHWMRGCFHMTRNAWIEKAADLEE